MSNDREMVEESSFFVAAIQYFPRFKVHKLIRTLQHQAKSKAHICLDEWIPLQPPIVEDARRSLLELAFDNRYGKVFKGILISGKVVDLFLYFVMGEGGKVDELGPLFISFDVYKDIWNKLRLENRFERKVYEEIQKRYSDLVVKNVMMVKEIPQILRHKFP